MRIYTVQVAKNTHRLITAVVSTPPATLHQLAHDAAYILIKRYNVQICLLDEASIKTLANVAIFRAFEYIGSTSGDFTGQLLLEEIHDFFTHWI